MQKIRVALLATEEFLENEYFQKYLDLIEANKATKAAKGKTQQHHIIPRAYFKHRELPIDNSAGNLVNLPVVDHVRAHLYMMRCSASNDMRGINAAAVKFTCDTLDLNILLDREAELEEAFLEVSKAKAVRMSERRKAGWGSCRVICVETGQIYDSITEAEQSTGFYIGECLSGKFGQSGGYHWKYVDKPTPEYVPKIVRFTEQEIALLLKEYPENGPDIPDLLARHSRNNIYSKAHALGISRNENWRSKR